MGKWAEVQCACPNRKPVPGSDFMFGKPHRNKRRLTKKQSEEVAESDATGITAAPDAPNQTERLLVERLVFDSPDQFVLAQERGAGYVG